MGVSKATGTANQRPSVSRPVGLVAALILAGVVATLVRAQSTPLELVSVGVENRAGNRASNGPAVNADGRFVAFFSDATDLVRGDTNETRDVFLRDRVADRTERISIGVAGAQSNGASHAAGDAPAITADGNIVAFYSDATNLVANDQNGHTDVFVRLRPSNANQLVSLSTGGTAGDGDSLNPSIDAIGRNVAFQSLAANLVGNDTNGVSDIFVRDRSTGTTERVCDAVQANKASFSPAISADGRIVAFASAATNLVPDDTNNLLDVFACDRTTGKIDVVSVSSAGTLGNGDSILPAVSADGRFVAYKSLASNLVNNDRNGLVDVFIHDRQTKTTERISVSFLNGDSNDVSYPPAVDCSGRFVAFGSQANNIFRGDENELASVFVRDRGANFTSIIDVNERGEQANGATLDIAPAITCDGSLVAFTSLADNLTNNDPNENADIYIATVPTTAPCRIDGDCGDNNACTADHCNAEGRCVFEPTICNAADSCHEVGVCNPDTGVCSSPVKTDGTPCTDGSLCTAGDVCVAGSCTGSPKDCSTTDACHTAGQCNPANGLCPNAQPDGKPCSDGNLCSSGDSCQGSICVGTPKDCSQADDCHTAGQCNPQTGLCPNPQPDNKPCSDGNQCTSDDKCTGSVCVGTIKDCSVADQCHDAGACNPQTGLCPNPRPDDTVCNDGNACTSGDACKGSICKGTNKDCSVADACHDAGACNPTTGLCPNPRPNGTTCSDNNLCTSDDACQGSVCVGSVKNCAVADACHDAGSCNPQNGLCPNPRPDGATCSDNNLCTFGDACRGSVCVGQSKNCSTADACHDAGACDMQTGLCPNPRPNGTVCSDGDLCTSGDACQGSVCVGSPKNCSTADACHDAGACNPQTGMCPNARPNGTTCSDGNGCTSSDSCQGGFCQGIPKNCGTADACHDAGACEPVTGLCPNPRPDGTACSDGNLCTTGDSCVGSICSGDAKNCSTADACHDAGSCNPQTGLCPNPRPDGTTCSDNNLCTTGDACQGSLCLGLPKDCSMADACHSAGACNLANGLCPGAKPDGTVCSDGNLCTTGDACQGSLCQGQPKNCSAADGCHDAGQCNLANGLCPNPKPDGTTCSDGKFCTSTDQCKGSVCTPGGNTCDDGLFCNGQETCDEANDRCVAPTGKPCTEPQVCDEGLNKCVTRGLDRDGCQCSMSPGEPHNTAATWLWVSAIVGLVLRRRATQR